MKVRTIYFKVPDMQRAASFWEALLGVKPHKTSSTWHEFMVGSLRLGLLLNDFGDRVVGSNCVPVWELPDEELPVYIERAKSLGAQVLVDGLSDEKLKSVVFVDPFGNEFELSKFHE